MKKAGLAGAALVALIGAATIPALAMAHGSMSDPPSRSKNSKVPRRFTRVAH